MGKPVLTRKLFNFANAMCASAWRVNHFHQDVVGKWEKINSQLCVFLFKPRLGLRDSV